MYVRVYMYIYICTSIHDLLLHGGTHVSMQTTNLIYALGIGIGATTCAYTFKHTRIHRHVHAQPDFRLARKTGDAVASQSKRPSTDTPHRYLGMMLKGTKCNCVPAVQRAARVLICFMKSSSKKQATRRGLMNRDRLARCQSQCSFGAAVKSKWQLRSACTPNHEYLASMQSEALHNA